MAIRSKQNKKTPIDGTNIDDNIIASKGKKHYHKTAIFKTTSVSESPKVAWCRQSCRCISLEKRMEATIMLHSQHKGQLFK